VREVVHPATAPPLPHSAGSQTGTVIVLTTPDAQRSFISWFSSQALEIPPELEAAVARTRVVVLEGYLFELPGAAEKLATVIRVAKRSGALVALTAGDAGLVARCSAQFLGALHAGVDLLLTNADEAAALAAALAGGQQHGRQEAAASTSAASSSGQQQPLSAEAAAKQLASHVPMAVVTDGSRGSYITGLGELLLVPPCWMGQPPADTCGAGDAYAGGLLWGLLTGLDLWSVGQAAARTASAVIAHHGAQLSSDDASAVVASVEQALVRRLPQSLSGGGEAAAAAGPQLLEPGRAVASPVL